MSKPNLIRVRASINLADLRVGEVTSVDPDDPLVAPLLDNGYLVREDEPAARKTKSES